MRRGAPYHSYDNIQGFSSFFFSFLVLSLAIFPKSIPFHKSLQKALSPHRKTNVFVRFFLWFLVIFSSSNEETASEGRPCLINPLLRIYAISFSREKMEQKMSIFSSCICHWFRAVFVVTAGTFFVAFFSSVAKVECGVWQFFMINFVSVAEFFFSDSPVKHSTFLGSELT